MDLTAVREVLAGFAGGTARLHGYTSSHDRLTLELQDATHAHRVHLVLIGCTRLHLKTLWRVQDLRIDRVDSGFLLADEEVEVLFEHEVQIADAIPE